MHPFHDGDASATFRNHAQAVIEEINALDNEYVSKAALSELETHFLEKATFSPLSLKVEERYIQEQSKTKIDVTNDPGRAIFSRERVLIPGTKVTIAIPFEGDAFLFQLRPSTYSLSGYPEILIRGNVITFDVSFPDDSPNADRLKNEIDRHSDSLVAAVNNLANDVSGHNQVVETKVKTALQAKRERALAALSTVSELGIPMRRQDEPPSYTIPTQRRKAPSLPSVPTGAYQPEPTLAEEEYQYILGILRSMALVIERSPHSFSTLDEEAIRTHFLLQLNGHYKGAASGETFNASGKTDILIRVGDRNVFIAECKFWRGPKGLDEALDQLLGYLTWRDSKCALLMFNRNKDASAVSEKMHEAMESRQEHRKTVSKDASGDSRYIFVKKDDPGRQIVITTQLFDFPS